jgi:LysR family transcriptional regulator, glycine cleavage system transcriptional activator
MSERRHLPPTGALASFAAAARHGSFSRAGEEVGLTQSAVSRQIALLEDWLQTPLFDRTGRRVALNADGRAYADEITPALDRIRRATARLATKRPDNALSIATLPSFGMRWLAPRLPRFTAEHPDLVVNFAAQSDTFDFAEEDFDAAIHFGLPDWPGAAHDFLFRETSIPVCAPAWLAANPLAAPGDLIGKPLLFQTSRKDAWTRWFRLAGVTTPTVSGPTFEHFLMLAQAAAAGAGAALIPSFLIEPELASGALVSPFDLPLATDDAYYLVSPESGGNEALARFRDWVVREAASS